MATKINNCAQTDLAANLQARHELAKLQPIETDDLNENDVRVVATQGDNYTPWVRVKDAETAISDWNDANPAK